MSGFEKIRVGALGPTVSVEEAAELLGIGRTLAYRLAADGDLPVPVLRMGRKLRIPTGPLLAALGMARLPGQEPGRGGESGPGAGSDQDA